MEQNTPHDYSRAVISSVISLILITGLLVWFHFHNPKIPPPVDQQLDDTLQINQGRIPDAAAPVCSIAHYRGSLTMIYHNGYYRAWGADAMWYSKDRSTWFKGWPDSCTPSPALNK